MSSFSSKEVERKVLASLLMPSHHIKANELSEDIFTIKEHQKLFEILGKYIRKYSSPPTSDTLEVFVNDLKAGSTATELEITAKALVLMKSLPKLVDTEVSFYIKKAEDLRMGRELFDVAGFLKDSFENGVTDFASLRQKVANKVLMMCADESKIRRGFIYETVEERWKAYRKVEKGEQSDDVIPWGIASLDNVVGGLCKTFVTLIYSKSSGGKSRTAINAAYNAAQAGKRVMFMTLEMAFDKVANCFDSRAAWVDSHDIIFGKLQKDDKEKFKKALLSQRVDRPSIWLSDIPRGTKPSVVMAEIELYKSVHGVPPDLVVIDYVGLMEPDEKYAGRSEKYGYIFKALHELARYENVAILTAAQESRDASKADLKSGKKDEETEGVHNIGLSSEMAPHCETVLRLKQDKFDKLQNRLWVIIDKSRYGRASDQIKLVAQWEYTYVGDKTSPMPIRVMKESK